MSQAQGVRRHCGPEDGAGHRRRGLRNGMGAQRHGLWEDDVVVGLRTASWAWGRGLCCRQCHRLGSGKMVARKGLDSGRQRWCGDSGEDTMRAWRL
jgi:hypothetical protein